MNFSLMYARKGTYSLWLDKSGNKYTVSDFDAVQSKTLFREEYDTYDDADRRFKALCAERGMTPTPIDHDPNSFRFD